MNVLMYPIAPDDDFPDEFCAIRQGSGEHWFYTPAGEDASWMLFRAESENAKLRELVRDMFCAVHPADREKFLTNVAELGVEVDR